MSRRAVSVSVSVSVSVWAWTWFAWIRDHSGATLSIFLIPAALVFMFGRLVGDPRQGWAVLAALTAIFVVAVVVVTQQEQLVSPLLAALGADQAAGVAQPGGNMEGKEARFGIAATGLFAAITAAASCGAVNAMHDSFSFLASRLAGLAAARPAAAGSIAPGEPCWFLSGHFA